MCTFGIYNKGIKHIYYIVSMFLLTWIPTKVGVRASHCLPWNVIILSIMCLFIKAAQAFLTDEMHNIWLQWVPGHSNLEINECTNYLAKHRCQKNHVLLSDTLSYFGEKHKNIDTYYQQYHDTMTQINLKRPPSHCQVPWGFQCLHKEWTTLHAATSTRNSHAQPPQCTPRLQWHPMNLLLNLHVNLVQFKSAHQQAPTW